MQSKKLVAAVALALGGAITSGAHAQVSGGVIKIGVMSDMSSLYADIGGPGSVAAAKLAAADFAKSHPNVKVEIVSASEGEHGGFKELIANVTGNGVYGKLKFESGAHRVQRVPETESQGRIHTSACTVAVLPEIAESEAIEISKNDLRVDTFRASGAGGQHVNKTDSAIRLTHLPSGIVVECQDERSQHKNRAKAMSLLLAKLEDAETERQRKDRADARKSLVGSGDRSERIRTYNFPQGRLTDHRINLTLYKLEEVVAGDLDEVVGALMQEHQADLLAAMTDE